MLGFDARWTDVTSFINGITYEIWEGRQIGSLSTRYAPGLVVRSPASVLTDNSQVIAATMATLAEFPDRQLLGEDVIWCRDEARSDNAHDAFLSSHRLICTATHLGSGVYGPPTNRPLRYRILADCATRDDRVDDEWLVRDQAAIVCQLGLDPRDWARDLIRREGGPDACVRPMTPETDVQGPYGGRGNEDETGQRLAALIGRIMAADFSAISREYDRAASLHYPRHFDTQGHRDADRFWMGLRAAFPSSAFSIDHVIGRTDDAGMLPRAAVRWSLWGKHDGWGMFGRPTGAPVYVMGITHAEFGPWGLRREWTLLDETAIWKQIHLATGDHDG